MRRAKAEGTRLLDLPHKEVLNTTKEQEREQATYLLAMLPKLRMLRHLPQVKRNTIAVCQETING